MSLATDIANLETRRANICAKLAAIATGKAGHYPTATGPGANPDHDGHVKRLWWELGELDKLLASLKQQQSADGGSIGEAFTQAW